MKALHLINGEHYAGAERVQDLLAQYLPGFGVEVILACLKPKEFPQRRHAHEAELILAPMRGRWDLRPVGQLAHLVRQRGVAVIHSHTPRAAVIGHLVSHSTGVPWVHHIHGHTATEVRKAWWARAVAMLENRLVRRAQCLLAVSDSAAQYLKSQGIPENRIRVVPNGIPVPEKLPPRPAPEQPWNLGAVGLWRPRKGLEVLILALELLWDRGTPARVCVVGTFETPAYRRKIVRLINQAGLSHAVHLLGFCSDVSSQLAQMDLLVFPSLLPEGMPMVLLEALAAGVPVVASRVPGVEDVISQEVGQLVPPGEPASLARAITSVLEDPDRWAQMRRQGHAWVRQRFSALQMARQVALVYQDLTGQKLPVPLDTSMAPPALSASSASG